MAILKTDRKDNLSDEFIHLILENSVGNFSRVEYDSLFDAFNREIKRHYFTRNSESNLIRIFNSIFNKVLFLRDCLKYPHHIEIITAISANSNFLTDVTVRNTEFLYQLFNPSYLTKNLTQGDIEKEISKGLRGYKSYEAKVNYLRIVKNRHLLKIGLNDVLGNLSLKEITEQLSVLAKAVNKFLFQMSVERIAEKYELEPETIDYTLLALGKLGGDELNYSSDIDLILVHEKDVVTSSGKTVLEILNETTKLYVETATQRTSRGYLYRIDFRLRPDGKTSPLSINLSSFISYYESRGEPWERQMLIKSSFVAGSNMLYDKISEFTSAYVYQSLRDHSPVAEIKRMKENIESQSDTEHNIKTVRGGIRDIEFSIQALQLLNGYKHQQLRSPNTINSINQLRVLKIITGEEADDLSEAYEFYRKIEHYLQLMNDTQTHVIPDDHEMINKLANYCGLTSASAFKKHLHTCKERVRDIYTSIILDEEEQIESANIESIKFENPKRALTNLQYLENGTGLVQQKQFDSRTTESFKKFSDFLLSYLNNSGIPDLVLENFAKVVHSSSFISPLYRELADENLLKGILTICGSSQYSVDLILTDSSLLDMLITRSAFSSDLENIDTGLSIKQVRFLLSVQYTLGIIDQKKLSLAFTSYVSQQLKTLIENQEIKYKFLLAGMGSFGVGEMNLNSDIDLLILVNSEDAIIDVEQKTRAFLAEAANLLGPVEIDFRLRPEGKSSQLVWDIGNYKKYLADRADVWEFMSLLKVNYVAGDESILNDLRGAIVNSINSISKNVIRQKIIEMYDKFTLKPSAHGASRFDIKRSKGGLATINFILQALILLGDKIDVKLLGADTREIISRISSIKEFEDIKELLNSYNFFKRLESSILFALNSLKPIIPEDNEKKSSILRNANFSSIENFNKYLADFIKLNNKMFNTYVQT